MWKDGAVVAGTGSNGFANSVTNPLDIYGLAAPVFEFKEAAASTYQIKKESLQSEQPKFH